MIPDVDGHNAEAIKAALVAAAGFDKKRRNAMLKMPILRDIGQADLIEVPVGELPGMFDQLPSSGVL